MRILKDDKDTTVELLNGEGLIPRRTIKPAECSMESLETKFSAPANEDYEHTHYCSHRWIVAYMGLWVGIMIYLFHTNMSVAIVCMVKQSVSSEPKDHVNNTRIETTTYQSVIMNNETLDIEFPANGELSWSKESQSLVLSGYYYGKILVQIPAGWLTTRFGGRRVIGCGMSVAFVVTLLIPMLARTSVYLVTTARFVLGIFVSACSPSYFGLAGIWALPTERSRFMGLFQLGETIGTVIGYSSSGYLCAYGFDNGWGSIFYVHGIFGIIFVACWFAMIYDSPEQHPRTTESERLFIRRYLQEPVVENTKHIPWRNILRYGPIYAYCVSLIGDMWILFLLVTCLPLYMKEVLQFDIQNNGLFSSLPFVMLGIGLSISGLTADYIRKKGIISITRLRKILVCIGFFGAAVFIVIPGYLQKDYREFAIVSICISMLFVSIESAGYCSNVIDIAPRYSSVIFGLTNTFATLPGTVAPIIVAAITKHQTVEEWRIVFYLTAGISASTAIVFLIFGDSEQADWSKTTTTSAAAAATTMQHKHQQHNKITK